MGVGGCGLRERPHSCDGKKICLFSFNLKRLRVYPVICPLAWLRTDSPDARLLNRSQLLWQAMFVVFQREKQLPESFILLINKIVL